MPRVVFLLTPQVYLLDLAGPVEVFHTAEDFGLPYQVSYVADQVEVVSAEHLRLRASTSWPALDPQDLIIVPGGRATTLDEDEATGQSLDVLRSHHRQGGMVVGICAGAASLGRAGLLDGRRCTTHHRIQDELATAYPAATVVKDVLYVVDGRIATSAGMASGIDLALHLVAAEHGPGVAARIARSLVVYARRNGQEQQVSAMVRHRHHLSDLVHQLQDLIEKGFANPLRLIDLAHELGCSERTITRHFREATGLTPLRYQQTLRLEHAERLIAQGATVETAAHGAGLADARTLRALRKTLQEPHLTP
jgi:transcriptional regulator GlxA family with amidase domain